MSRHAIWTLAIASCLGLAACGDDTGDGAGGAGAGSSGTMSGDGGAGTGSSGGNGLVHGSPAEGVYLFALSAKLNNEKPILFQGNVVFGEDAAAPTFTMQLTPLRTPYREGADNQSIDPLTPLPPALDLGPFDLAQDGSFDAQFPEVQVTGKANTFSPNDLKAVVAIHGRFTEDPSSSPEKLGFVCGTLEGNVISPIALVLTTEENFFSMTKLDGPPPNEIAYDCAGNHAVPFSEEGTGGAGGGGEGGSGEGGGAGTGGAGTGGDGTGGSGTGGDGTGGAGTGGAAGSGGAGGQ